ncbi:hypothetical protein Lalb_Chr06g0170981 [Lupinus albus]|uniref:Uncharacterized protein n=1 Tax=Lupinus albus TaxID=3870 RepID=A0A6A4QFD0_LUPAL|nr:hypothetical protein Lalb_Chr06g0170981 [Lupinus albus]
MRLTISWTWLFGRVIFLPLNLSCISLACSCEFQKMEMGWRKKRMMVGGEEYKS